MAQMCPAVASAHWFGLPLSQAESREALAASMSPVWKK